jgi:SAM-dependent methyltransferase
MRQPDVMNQSARVYQSAARLVESLTGAPLVTVECPACGSVEQSPAATRQGFTYVRCGNCSCLYISRRPTEDALLEMYRRFPESAAGDEVESYDSRDEVREARYRFQRVLQVARSGRLLDVGCGRGDFLRAAQLSFEVFGVDVAARLEASDLEIRFFEGRLEDASFEEGSFQIVTAFEVLEHLFDPASTLREVHRVLADKGLFVFQTGDSDSLRARLAMDSWPYLQPPVHLNIFGRRSLAMLMQRTGFRIAKSWSFGKAARRVTGLTGLPYPEFLRPVLDVTARFGLIGRLCAAIRVEASPLPSKSGAGHEAPGR